MSDNHINTRTPITTDGSTVNRIWFLFFDAIKRKTDMFTGKVSSTATAGAAPALPATPEGYIVINIEGTDYKVPYYK